MTARLFAAVAAGYFAASLVATVLAATDTRLGRFIKAHDPFAVVPVWTFFAPRPGIDDMRILYRDRLRAGIVGDWREVEPPRNRWIYGLWHPEKRVQKAVMDACSDLLVTASQHRDDELPSRLLLLSAPYLLLLNYAQAQPRDFRTEARQFLIVKSTGPAGPDASEILFASPFHVLTRLEESIHENR